MKKSFRMWGENAVSPVIATVMLVAVTIVLSGVLLVLVMSMMDTEGVSPTGILDVKKSSHGENTYEISIRAMTFSIPADDAFLAVNGDRSIRSVDSHTEDYPYTGHGFEYHAGQSPPSQIGTGSRLYLEVKGSLLGSVISLQLQKQNGAVIASTKFFDARAAGGSIWMGGAEWGNGDAASFPLVFDGGSHVTVPRDNIADPTRYLNVSVELMLTTSPSDQDPWATIININGDRGYRLQLSGDRDGPNNNQWFQFGASGWVSATPNRINSDGTGGGTPVEVHEGVRYQVWGVMDFDLKEISIWVNATGDTDTMVLAGIKDYDNPDMPNIGDLNWFLGDRGSLDRSFEGEIYWLNVETY